MAGRCETPEPALGLDPRVPAIHVLGLPRLEVAGRPRRDTLRAGRKRNRMNDTVSQDLVDRFVAHWSQSSGAERANFQSFANALCELIGVPLPDPKREDPSANSYTFEYDVKFKDATGRKARVASTSTRKAASSSKLSKVVSKADPRQCRARRTCSSSRRNRKGAARRTAAGTC